MNQRLDAPKKRTGAALARGQSKQDYGTPRDFLSAVQERFGRIAWDLAAHTKNFVTDEHHYLGPGSALEENSLAFDWHQLYGTLWLNPPFGRIEPWAARCAECRDRRDWLVLLVPAAVDSVWFAENVQGKGYTMPLSPRLTFEGEKDPYPKGLMAIAYGFGVCGFEPWRWRP